MICDLRRKSIIVLLREYKLYIFMLMILPFFRALFNSYFFSKYTKYVIDDLIGNRVASAQITLLKIIGVFLFLQYLVYVCKKILSKFLELINCEIKKQTIAKFNKITLNSLKINENALRVHQLSEKIVDSTHMCFTLVYKPFCSLLINIYTMFWLNPVLGKIFMIFAIIFLVTFPKMIQMTFGPSKQLNHQQNKMELFMEDISNNFFFEKLFRLQNLTKKLFMTQLAEEKVCMKNKFDALALAGLYGNILCAGSSAIMQFTAISLNIPVALKITCLTLINKFFMEFNEIPNAVIPLLNNLGAIRENLNLFAAEEEKEKQIVQLHVQKIELKDISFTYDNNKYIFKKFSYTFHPGLYWIKGESGKGKSTLIKLLAGLLEPVEGDVVFNGEYSSKFYALQENISYMTQNDGIYHRTVMENITFEQPSPHIVSYCQKFQMADILHYKCEVGGLNISGGQVRRIGLLRLINFYRNGNVVIFDEPLVGLNEKLVEETVEFILSFKGIVLVCEHTNLIEKYHPIILNI